MKFSVDSYFAEQDTLSAQEPRATQVDPAADFQIDEGSEVFSFEDTLAAIPRGIEGFGRSVASLVPGVDLGDERFFGRSDTVVGAGLESIVQFGLGFLPGVGIAGRLGKLGGIAKAASAIKAVKGGRFILAITEGSTAGAIADFTAFDGHEKNFSALIESVPALQNPLTEFLATDEEEPEVIGRIKNVIEGLGMGAAVGILLESMRGLKAVRKARTVDAPVSDLANAQKGAVDPGRANEGIKDTLNLKSRPDADLEGTAKASPENPQRAGAAEHASDTPEGKEALVRQLTGEEDEAVDDVLQAFETSEATRVDPNGNPRKRSKWELLRDKLTVNNKNIEPLALSEGGAHVVRALEDLNMGALKGQPIPNAETVAQTIGEFAALAGRDFDEAAEVIIQRVRESKEGVRSAMATALAGREALQGLLEGQANLIEKALQGSKSARKRILDMQPVFKEILEEVNDLGTAGGQLLQSLKIRAAEAGPLREISETFSRGLEGKDMDVLFDQMSLAYKSGDGLADAASVMRMQEITLGRQVYKATNELFINSILSGFKTLTVQPLSAMTASIYKPLENMIGGGLTGNGTLIRRSMQELLSLSGVVTDSAKLAWKTARTNQAILDPTNFLRDDSGAGEAVIRAGLFNTTPGTFAGNAMDALGKIVNMPTRLIKSVDEFSKQVEFRSVIKADFITQELEKGATHADALATAEARMKKIVVEGQIQTEAVARKRAVINAKQAGIKEPKAVAAYVEANYQELFDPSASESITKAFDAAQEVTLQTPLEPGGAAAKVQSALDSIPLGRFIVPFYRTPVNVAKFAGQRLDVVSVIRYQLSRKFDFVAEGLEGTRSRFLRDMMSDDPVRKAEAVGRVTTGLGLLTTGGMMASAGLITGRGPSDPDRRKAMTDAGWQPYSFKTPNGYVQFGRMDPLATFFGLMGDMFDTLRLQGEDDDDAGNSIVMAALVSVANNFTQKSFMAGLGQAFDALSDPSKNMGSIVEQYAGSVVPSGLAQMVGAFGDDSLKDTQGALERIISRTPGISETATPRRNLLGEVINRSEAIGEDAIGEFYGLFVPIAYREVTSDTIRKELFNLRHGFSPPKARMVGLDLREIKSATGQGAHDRWTQLQGQVRLGGRSLRQELTKLIRSSSYRRLSGDPSSSGPSPRVALINQVVSRYRDKAFDSMLREFPELAREIQQREASQLSRKRGLSALRSNASNIGAFPR